MGVVYKAEDTKLGRVVALKFLRNSDPDLKKRFQLEAQAAALLHHPNICTVFEIDEARGFIAMEFVEGPTLREKIAERPLRLEQALDIAAQLCTGLEVAHQKGVIHRDIKPANIMIGAQGEAKIMDFGLARLGEGELTQSGATTGTPAYMSPEQVRGEATDRRTDIWGLGVVLYEMIAGRAPFEGPHNAALGYGIVHSEHEALTARRAGLPLDIDRVISKLLAKDPAERYQRAEDLAVDLRALRSLSSDRSPSGKRTISRRIIPRMAAGLVCAEAGIICRGDMPGSLSVTYSSASSQGWDPFETDSRLLFARSTPRVA